MVFGQGDSGVELWLGVVLPHRRRSRTRLQWLQEITGNPGCYELTTECESYSDSAVQHTFSDVQFTKTTTYQLTRSGRRKKTGKVERLETKGCIDASVLAELLAKARKHAGDHSVTD